MIYFFTCDQVYAYTTSVTSPTTVITAADKSKWGGYDLDSQLNTIKMGTNDYKWFTTRLSSTTMTRPLVYMRGPLTDPDQTVVSTASTLINFPTNYAPWIVGVYNDPGTGMYLGWIHLETQDLLPNGRENSKIGLAKSTDGGSTWTYLGDIYKPRVTDAQIPDNTFFNVTGGGLIKNNGYFYFYVQDSPDGIISDTAVIRKSITSVITDAQNGTVGTWNKYYNGLWNESALGGLYTPLNAWFGHLHATWNTYLNKFVSLTKDSDQRLGFVYSDDGINWSDMEVFYNETTESKWYLSVVTDNADPTQSGQSFDVYYYNPDLHTFKRMTVTFTGGTGPQPSNYPVLIDNSEVSTEMSGTWLTSTASDDIGADYRHDNNNHSGPALWYKWYSRYASTMDYEVYVWLPAGTGRATNALVIVNHEDIRWTTTIDQNAAVGYWKYIGTFKFRAGTHKDGDNVIIQNQLDSGSWVNGKVIADAVRFVPVVQATGPLLSDDFNDGSANGWTTTGTTWSIVTDGTSRYQGSNTSGETSTNTGNSAWTNYTVEVKGKVTSIASDGSGPNLLARYQDHNNMYRFGYSMTSGVWKIWKKVSNVWYELAVSSAFTLNTNTEYTVKAELNGNSLKLYVDGNLQASATDSTFSSGKVGLLVYKSTVKYDDVVVKNILFSDDFNDGNANGWTPTGSTWSIVTDGTSRYQGSLSTYETLSVNGSSWNNYTLESKVKATTIAADGSGPTILARYMDGSNYYRFGYSMSGGNWKIMKKSAGSWTTLANGPAFTINLNTDYTLKAEVNGTSLKLYVNSGSGYVLQASATDSTFSSGQIGLYIWKSTIKYDDVVVTGL